MKYIAALASAAAVSLSVVTAASAAPTWSSLIPPLTPHPALWLKLLQEQPSGAATVHRHGTTVSIYEQTTSKRYLYDQGCNAAREGRSGVAILDFGQLAKQGRHYGTNLFSGRFAANWKITNAVLRYAEGYAGCATSPSEFITVARGTSNYHPALRNAYVAGRAWARETDKVAKLLVADGFSQHVASAAGDDAEPAWDPRFHKTHDFFRGYGSMHTGETLYDYGSLDGGVGSIWSARQAFYVSGGMREAKVLPEIYSKAMAEEWAKLATVAQRRLHKQVRFAGVLTEATPGCHRRCTLKPAVAHRVLRRELADYGVAGTTVPSGGSNMGSY